MAATRTVTEILDDVINAFFGKYPFLGMMIKRYEVGRMILNQVYNAKINLIPAISSYANGAGGFFPTATTQKGETLQEDVGVKADLFPLVHIPFTYYQSIQDDVKSYDSLIELAADRLAKHFVDAILGKAVADNFTESTTVVAANADSDLLDQITTDMNAVAADEGRYLLVNSAVAGALAGDDRLASRDYHGQPGGGSAYRRWDNVNGFRAVIEYPSLPANGENLVGIAFDARAFAIVQGTPDANFDLRELVDAPPVQSFKTHQHTSGFSLISAAAEKRGEPDVDWSIGGILGIHAGTGSDLTPANAATAGKLTDYAGHRLVTA